MYRAVSETGWTGKNIQTTGVKGKVQNESKLLEAQRTQKLNL